MILLAVALLAAPASAQAPLLTLSLAQAESSARAHALDARAAAEESAAARDAGDAQFASLVPRLTLDGFYKYQTEVPNFSPVPGQPPTRFGDNRSYGIGPTLTWTLWDEGALYKTWKSQAAGARSREEHERLISVLAVQAARLAYVQVQLAREKVRLLTDSVSLADAQHSDAERRLRAGAASRIDALTSHQEDIQRRKDFFAAQSDLASALCALFQLTGLGEGLDPSRAVDVRVSTGLPAGLPEPTLRVAFDSLAETPARLAEAESASGPAADHPAAAGYGRQAESARLAAGAAAAGLWPKIQFQGQILYEYPNGPVLQAITQKTAGLTASVPLFDMRQTSRLSDQQSRLARAAELHRDLAIEELTRDWGKAKAALASLRDQESLDAAAVAESEELARLVYLSYKAGRSSALDVQTYDVAALQAKVNAAQTRAQILIQLAALAELRGQG
jgi:outer membrane protein TolC